MAGPALTDYLRVYDGDLEPQSCAQLVASFQDLQQFQRPNGGDWRPGLDDSAWTELNLTRVADPRFIATFRRRIDASLQRYNAEVKLRIPIPNSPKFADLMLKRYRPGTGEKFQLHFDSLYNFANRYLVLLWYLNDVAEGGETVFPDMDRRIEPRQGRLLMFPPYWMYQHAGLAPISGEKYILSTYLLF